MEEIWKPIKGYEGYYEVSNHGRVKALGRKGSGCSIIDRIKKVTMPKDKALYPNISLCVNGKSKTIMVHRLVALAFVENNDPENKKEVNHIDGNKINNFASNLEWVSSYENTMHGLSLGIMNTANGLTKPHVKFSKADIIDIKTRLSRGELGAHIAKYYGVHKGLIYLIKNNKTWKHITI